MKTRKGSVVERRGKLYARIDYTDEGGRRRARTKLVRNETEARRVIRAMLAELEDRGPRAGDEDRVTFGMLAEDYADKYLVEPTYQNERKVSGLRSHAKTRNVLNALVEYFGSWKLRAISYGAIEGYRAKRLRSPVVSTGGNVVRDGHSVATVNRELALLRRILNVALREGLIPRNPFAQGDPLVNVADEKQRTRVLSADEESRLLRECTGPRAHLYGRVILAVDTGLRLGEITSLAWSDVDLDAGLIVLKATNTKTLRSRTVAMTSRVWTELRRMSLAKGKGELVFGGADFKHAWGTAKKLAGVADLRFHDLRHSAATRAVRAGLPLAEVSRVLGHSNTATSYRYINPSVEAARSFAAAMEPREETEGEPPIN